MGVAHNGTFPHGVSCRLGWEREMEGRGGGHLREERKGHKLLTVNDKDDTLREDGNNIRTL